MIRSRALLRGGEVAGWLAVAAVVVTAARSPRSATLDGLTPAVDAVVGAGWRILERAAGVPVGWLWLATLAAGVLVSAALVVGRGRLGGGMGWLAAATAFAAAWVAAAGGRPGWAVVAGAVTTVAVLTVRNGGPEPRPALVARAVVPWIVAAAAVVRLWNLEALPPGFGTHGTTHLVIALDLLEGSQDALLGGEVPPAEWLDSGLPVAWRDQHGPLGAVHALGFAVLGVGGVEARMTSALLGIATVWLVAVCGTWLGDRWLGVAAAALLAVAPWHVAFSRGNDAEHVLSPLHAVLALGLVARAVRRGGWVDWLAAGVTLGLSAYVYAPNQLVPLAAAVVLGVAAVTVPGALRHDAGRIAVAAALSLLVAGPHLAAWAASSVPVPIRSSVDRTPDGAYAVSRPDDLAPNLAASASQLLVRSDDEWLTVPTGMIGPTTTAAWLLGLGVCVAWWRDPRTRVRGVLPVALLAVGLLPGVLSAWVFARRLVLAATALELLAGAGLVALAAALRRRRVPSAIAAAVVAAAAAVHAMTGVAVYVETVEVPESLGSTVLPAVANVVRASVPQQPVVIAIAADAPFLDIEDAIRIGAAPAVRPLIALGHRRDDLWRVTTFDRLAETLDEIGGDGRPVLLVVPSPGAGPVYGPVRVALDGRGAGAATPIVDVRGAVVAWSWKVPAGMPAAAVRITPDVPHSPGG